MITEAGSYLRLIDSRITQLKAQGPSMTCNESKKEEEDRVRTRPPSQTYMMPALRRASDFTVRGPSTLNLTPYTLHPAPYALTPYTLHPNPDTLGWLLD